MIGKRRLVVVGNGMAGARLVENVVARGGLRRFSIAVFGDEPHGNYNRILLSSVLAGTHRAEDIFINPPSWYSEHGVTFHAGVRVESIDVGGRLAIGHAGIVEPYDDLVLATGSRAVLPPIAGLVHSGQLKPGAFVFRTLEDCERIVRHASASSGAVVIGGGLLGLEAARGLSMRGLDTHVVHLAPHLMETQLDSAAGALLARRLRQMGLRVHVKKATSAVLGADAVEGVSFADGSTLSCGILVIAAGIRPNIDLATRAGLQVERGIVVGDDLACAGAPGVYAIGECAEHRGRVYGLVAPGWEQADVLADRLTGRRAGALYRGSKVTTKLKVAGIDVAVMGDKDPVEEDDEVVTYSEPSRGIYKKLIVRGDRLTGAIVIGDAPLVPALVQRFVDARRITSNRAETLFPIAVDTSRPEPEKIPDAAQICDCNAVSKASIVEAVLQGARSVQAVSDATRACTGCGTCRPEVERIIEFACRGLAAPALLALAPAPDEPVAHEPDRDTKVVVTRNKIERFKAERDGLDVIAEVPRLARDGWESIDEGDRERLKWAGVFFRRQTPGRFMMRVRISNGLTNAAQLRVLADIASELGPGFVDLTTRQQVQLRGFGIDHVTQIWSRLEAVGLVSLQTGMDNVRNVIGCPVAGVTANELFDASPVVREFTDRFLRNREFTNLPRKFNVAITGCREHCIHTSSQDLALTPAIKTSAGTDVHGFNVSVGGKVGSGGYRPASPIDVFVTPEEAATLCAHVTQLFRDHGSRAARNRARLAFLVDTWGVEKFRRELQRRAGRRLESAGADAAATRTNDHLGVVRQRQPGLSYIGLNVPVGRITAAQLTETARLADAYGNGDVRITTSQNLIIPNVPDVHLSGLMLEPLLQDLSPDPHGAFRGLVSCTGIDYCHLALVETKELAIRTSTHLSRVLPHGRLLTMHWSGCPAGCGNHTLADIGLLGKNVRVGGEIIDAVDVFVGGKSGAGARPGTKILEDVPCEDLPHVLERVIPYLSTRRSAPSPQAAVAPPVNPEAGRLHADA